MGKKNNMIIQAIAYLVAKDSVRIDSSVSLFKLLFFADRYHLRMYGSTITGDKYVAMDMGPVPSVAKTMLDLSKKVSKLQEYVEWEGDGFSSVQNPDMDEFSESEIEALDVVIKFHKNHSTMGTLIDFSHQLTEWKKPSSKLRLDKGMELMRWEDWFESGPANDYCPADCERLKAAHDYWKRARKQII